MRGLGIGGLRVWGFDIWRVGVWGWDLEPRMSACRMRGFLRWGSGVRTEGIRFSQGLGFIVWGLGFEVWGWWVGG